jgi:hypothetical protein
MKKSKKCRAGTSSTGPRATKKKAKKKKKR